jgi:hypothetical protein
MGCLEKARSMSEERDRLLGYARRVEAGDNFEDDDLYEALNMTIEISDVGLDECLDGSLDACRTVHEDLLPNWEYQITSAGTVTLTSESEVSGHVAGDPARGWLAAIMRASAEYYP